MLIASITTVTAAIASDSIAGSSDSALMAWAGSGTISTAPIAVKWCETMASVSNKAAPSVPRMSTRRTASVSATAPSTMPNATEAATRL
jgi:hypothetical protein